MRMSEVLKQPQYQPMSLEQEVSILYAVVNGHLDDVPVDKARSFEEHFHRFLESNHPEILATIRDEKAISDQTGEGLARAIGEFKQSVPY